MPRRPRADRAAKAAGQNCTLHPAPQQGLPTAPTRWISMPACRAEAPRGRAARATAAAQA